MVTLLLQGPVGPFFAGLARELARRGDRVHQVCFNGGDDWFSDVDEPLRFSAPPEQWPGWLEARLTTLGVDRVILFGDCRPLHQAAIAVCRALGIEVWVMEEGYLRPHYLTLERDGVNARSALPADPAAYGECPLPPPPRRYRWVMARRAITCGIYYLAMAWRRGAYPHYRHHRRSAVLPELGCWLRAWYRRWLYQVGECRVLPRLRAATASGRPVFLLPLQVEGDSQLVHHSHFATMATAIEHVVASFAAHAPADALLVVKHHPMDRGYHHYGALLERLARGARLGDRLVYCHDQPLPALFPLLRGVVTVNSTVGMSALLHNLPVQCLGRAHYDIPGLTHQGSLAGFWRQPQGPDAELFRRFRAQVLARTQLNACSASARSTWDLLDRLDGFAARPRRVAAPPPVGSRQLTPVPGSRILRP